MELVVEIVTRSEKVLHVVPVTGDKITIGRGYDCDVILQEEHVCPLHACISQSEEGDLIITDESEVNGIRDKKQNPIGQKHILSSGDVFVLGKSYIRVLSKQHPVAKAKKLNPLEEFFNDLNTWYWALATMIVFTLMQLFINHQETFHDVKLSKTAIDVFLMALFLTVIPVIIGVGARIFKKEVKFFAIVAFFYAFICFSQFLSSLGQVLTFNWGEFASIHWGGELIYFGLSFVFLWTVFYLASNMSVKRISTVSVSLSVMMFGLIYLYSNSDDKVRLNPSISASVLPSGFLFTKPMAVNEYLENTGSLFDAALKEAERRNKEADEK